MVEDQTGVIIEYASEIQGEEKGFTLFPDCEEEPPRHNMYTIIGLRTENISQPRIRFLLTIQQGQVRIGLGLMLKFMILGLHWMFF
jgi:hypothetical protein